MESTNQRSYISAKEMIAFGASYGGQGMSANIIASYLTYFFVNVFNINAKAVSVVLAIEGIWDTINDPLMGSIVDKTRTRWGKLRPFLLGVPIPAALTTILFFAGPVIVGNLLPASPVKIAYMTVTYFLWETFYTAADVSFWGMSAAVSPNPKDRTKIITISRMVSSFVGGVPNYIIPVILDLVNAGILQTSIRSAFSVYGTATGIVGMLLFSLTGFIVKERIPQSSDEPSFKDCIKSFFTNRPLRLLLLKEILGALGNLGAPFVNYYNIDVLGMASYAVIAGIPATFTSAAGFACVPWFKRRFNNKQNMIFQKAFGVTLSLLKFVICIGKRRFARLGFMLPYLIVEATVSGFMAPITLILPTEMIAETVDYSEWTTGKRNEGIAFSAMAFASKISGTLSRAVGTWLIPVIGYRTSNDAVRVIQSAKTQRRIFEMTTIIPTALGLASFIPMFMYDLVGEKRERMYSELEQMRAALSEQQN